MDGKPTAAAAAWRTMGSPAIHPLVRLILGRLVGLVFVLAFVVVAVFAMVRLVPGDPVIAAYGEGVNLARLHELRHELGVDGSLAHQFGVFVDRLSHGDLGTSFQSRQPVSDLIRQRATTSLELAVAALVLVLGLSVPLGIVAGALTREGRHRRFEVAFTGITTTFGAVTDYVAATILVLIFAVELHWLPVAGQGSLEHVILPAVAIAVVPTMTLARIVRLETLNVLAQDYIRTARSQQLPARLIYGRHVFPNVITATLTVAGLVFAGIIGGAVIVETVFARAGLGSALIAGVISKDYPVVQGITLVFGVTVVVLNTIVDILIGIVDPRSAAKAS